jgi:hypothetical protein
MLLSRVIYICIRNKSYVDNKAYVAIMQTPKFVTFEKNFNIFKIFFRKQLFVFIDKEIKRNFIHPLQDLLLIPK